MSINILNGYMPGMLFNRGMDVSSDDLNGMNQYLSTELLARTKDFIKTPGFIYGFRIGTISGSGITLTAGSAIDQLGRRLEQKTDIAYKVSFVSSGGNSGYLILKANSADTGYKVHPYDGTRHPTETVMGLSLSIDTSTVYTDSMGNIYPNDNDGLIIAKITVSGISYTWDDTVLYRSPDLIMQNGN